MGTDRPSLSLSEVRVARLVADGRTDQEIAEQLSMSLGEVDGALAGVLQKLALRSRTELALLLPPVAGPVRPDDSP